MFATFVKSFKTFLITIKESNMAQESSQMNIPVKLAIDGISYLSTVWARRPYFGEIITNNILKVAVSVLFEGPLKSLTKNGNPTTESVVRDGLMSPGVLINVYNKQPIKEDYTYDVFSIVGTAVRGGGKVLFINSADYISYGLNYTLSSLNNDGIFNETLKSVNKDKVAFAARVGNVVMEPFSMLFNIIIPKDRQTKMPDGGDNTHIAWYLYMFSNFKSDWVTLASLGAVGRAFVPDQMGESYKWLKGFKFIQNPANQLYKMKNDAIESLFSVDHIDISDNVMDQISKARNQITASEENIKIAEVKSDAASISMFSLAFLFKLPEQLFQAYLIMIPTREAFDWISGELNNGYENIAQSMMSTIGNERLVGFKDQELIANVFQVLSEMVDNKKIKAVDALAKLKMFLTSEFEVKSVIKDIYNAESSSHLKDAAKAFIDKVGKGAPVGHYSEKTIGYLLKIKDDSTAATKFDLVFEMNKLKDFFAPKSLFANAIKGVVNLASDSEKKLSSIPDKLFKEIKPFLSNEDRPSAIKDFFKEANSLKSAHQFHVLVKIGGVFVAYNVIKMLVSPFSSVIKGGADNAYLYTEEKVSDAYDWSSSLIKNTSTYSFVEGEFSTFSAVMYDFISSNAIKYVDYYLDTKHFIADKVFSYQVAVDSYDWVFPENEALDTMVVDYEEILESGKIPSLNESYSGNQDIALDNCSGEFCIEQSGRVVEQEL